MKDMDRAIEACKARGLLYEQGKKHAKIIDPQSGRSISLSMTPSCPHAHRNMLRDVRKYLGIDIKIR